MIRRLAKEVVERIAAGEVIERPSSVLKELIENALDADAKQITIAIEGGGRRLLSVFDDGKGIAADELPLAFAPHATSKLSTLSDLDAIASYGFRGEALASIGAVSRARIVSRTRGADGHAVACEGGLIAGVLPAGAPPGTTVEVRNLFFNTPARARFLKGDVAESSRCLDVVVRFALISPGIGFRATIEGRTAFEVEARANQRERVAAAWGRETATRLIGANGEREGVRVGALLGPPDLAKGSVVHQVIYLNGRFVKDTTIRSAVLRAYREFLAPALQPQFLVEVLLDPAQVDVNVHPAKTEVRFRDASRIFRAVHAIVFDALRAGDLAPRVTRPSAAPPERVAEPGPAAPLPFFPRSQGVSFAGAPAVETDRATGGEIASRSNSFVPSVPSRTGAARIRLFETYIVFESGAELVLVDQHALHERVLYERLRTALARGPLPSQRLIVPAVVETGAAERARIEEIAPEAARFGLEVAPFGPATIAVHAVPQLLSRADPAQLVRALFDESRSPAATGQLALEDRLHDLACRAAVKAGDRLDESEIDALLDAAASVPEAKACPHGRPTSVRLARSELERWFKRSGF